MPVRIGPYDSSWYLIPEIVTQGWRVGVGKGGSNVLNMS